MVATFVYGARGMWVCNTMPCRRWVHHSVLRTSATRLTRILIYTVQLFRRVCFGAGCVYQCLPDPMLTVRNWMVFLVWLPGGLPSLTTRHMHSGLDFGKVAPALTNCYHTLPCLHSESPPVCDLYQPPPPARHTHRHTLRAHRS